MKNVLIAAASVMGIGLAAPAALAQEEFAIEFSYDRAELITEEGAQALYDRLQNEIEDACEVSTGSRDLESRRFERACIEETTRNAVQTLNSHHMNAVHETETGETVG